MKIALVGATGNVGTRIIAEATARGHTITAIARNVSSLAANDKVSAKQGDITDPATAEALKGHDCVILSVRFQDFDFDKALATLRASAVSRVLIVGGAASLEVAPGQVLLDTPDFPDFIKPEAEPARQALNQLRGVTDLDWVFLSPSVFFGPGERTGKFRLGGDNLLTAEDGKSHISYEDYAVALLDEIEMPAHHRARFTVGY